MAAAKAMMAGLLSVPALMILQRLSRQGHDSNTQGTVVSTVSPRLVLSLGERGRPHVVTNNVCKMVKSLLHKQLVKLVKSPPSQIVSLPVEVQA